MLIDNEKKSQERQQERSKKSNVESKEDTKSIEIVDGIEDPYADEGITHVAQEPNSEIEPVISEEKTDAEEIIDESKS